MTRKTKSKPAPFAVSALALILGSAALVALPARAQTPPAPDTAAKNAPRLVLEPEQTGDGAKLSFFAPGAVRVRVTKENAPPGATVRWAARDFAGKTVAGGILDSGANTIALNAVRPGIVYVTAEIVGADNTVLGQGETRFAVLRPRPLRTGARAKAGALPILYGACAHLGGKSEADAEREVALMAALGFRGCRFDYNWNNVQPARDQWNWTTFDRIFGLMEKYAITPLPIVAYTAQWASTGDPKAKDWHEWHNAPPVTADYARFASESVKRYGRTTRYWEIWNEPDIAFWLGTPEQYATLFDAAKTAIHQADPKAQVMNGGFSETRRRPDFIPTWMKTAGMRPDIFAYHSHNAFANTVRAAEHVKEYLKPAGWTMPVWLNEAGYSSAGRQTERDQAIALVKKMSAAPALGFSGYFVYDIRNDGTSPDENEHNFGLVRQDFAPKAAAVAVHTLLETLDNQRFVRRVPIGETPGAWVLLFERADHKAGTLVLWSETATTVPLLWRIPAKATGITLMGERTTLASASGLVSLPLTPEPQFVAFTGAAEKVAVAGRLLQFDSSISAGPGDTAPFRITVRNPLSTPLRGTLELAPGGGWTAKPSRLAVDVPANGSREYRTAVSATTAPGLSVPRNMAITVSSPALPGAVTARVPLLSAVIAPRQGKSVTLSDPAERTVPIKTLGRDNVVSLFEATPMQELLFRGDRDLSARVYLTRPPEGLLVNVRVRDNVFTQTEATGDEWKGDSLQFALSLPTGEHYEWLVALTKSGPLARLTLAPSGVPVGAVVPLPLLVRRDGEETFYDLLVPETLPGGKRLPDRFRFNVLVNDNDGAGRKGWLEWTPGIGQTKDPTVFQSVIVR